MKLAIVHDWIIGMGGAERVLKQMHRIWPDAPIYTLFADRNIVREHFPLAEVRTSRLQSIPGITRIYPALAPVMPSAVESFDLSGYDTVLSSSVIFAKGVIVRPGTHHISYCYSPARPLWDRAFAYERSGVASRLFRHLLRVWDSQAARRPDQMVAISQTVADRISTYYRRDAMVIPPPVAPATPIPISRGDYFLLVARPVPHKNIAMVREAFAKLRYPLIIANGVSDQERDRLYAGCRAVIVANEEDFGLTAVEAMTYGKPVLALRKGGATETVIEGITGEFFDDPIPEALVDGVRRIMRGTYNPIDAQKHASRYSEEVFAQRMRTLVG